MNTLKKNRSLSPHLCVYRSWLTSSLSIFHRLTGFILALLFLCGPIWFMLLDCFSSLSFVYVLFPYLPFCLSFVFFGLIFALVFHCFNGLRHLIWDFGIGLKVHDVLFSGYLVISLTLFLICVFLSV